MVKGLPISGSSTRPLTLTDIQKLKDFDRLATYEHNDTPTDHQPPEYTDEELHEGLKDGGITGIFDQDGNMIAYYWLELRPTELYIGGLAVHPDYRSRGVGQFIMHQAEEAAIKNKRNICTLTVDPYNGRGLHVYLKEGYRITGYERDAFGTKGCTRFHMEKYLTTRELPHPTEELRIAVNDSNASQIEEALSSGYIGTSLIRSDLGDKENIVVFTK